jgi:putative hydrolase of the HAD superfamily
MPHPTGPIFFDFGNVVAYFDYLILFGRFGKRVGLTAEAFRDRLAGRGFDSLLADFERGALTPELFAATLCRHGEIEVPFAEFVPDWSDIFRPNESVCALIAGLKAKGYPIYLGSNTNALHADHYRRQLAATLGLMDGFVLSYEVGHNKPAPEFFRACSEVARTPPESCIFIDDLDENIAGARRAGLRGIVYRDTKSLVDDLRELGVDAPEASARETVPSRPRRDFGKL